MISAGCFYHNNISGNGPLHNLINTFIMVFLLLFCIIGCNLVVPSDMI